MYLIEVRQSMVITYIFVFIILYQSLHGHIQISMDRWHLLVFYNFDNLYPFLTSYDNFYVSAPHTWHQVLVNKINTCWGDKTLQFGKNEHLSGRGFIFIFLLLSTVKARWQSNFKILAFSKIKTILPFDEGPMVIITLRK